MLSRCNLIRNEITLISRMTGVCYWLKVKHKKMHFNEMFIVSSSESVLIHKPFRLDVDEKAKEIFLKILKEKGLNQPPHFHADGKYFYNIRRGGLYFVATSGHEISPIMVIEILCRFYSIVKDFCGTVSEDSLQANNLLILEILNEFADFGYVQIAKTEKLQPYIQSCPEIVKQTREATSDITSRVFGIETRVPPSSPVRSVVSTSMSQDSRKNELFVDIIEKLTGVINADGTASRLEVSGSMTIKNFISGSSQVKIALNEDLSILEGKSKAYGNHVQLDQCNFHQCVKLEEFEKSKVMTIIPPTGEFSAMTYNTCGDIVLSVPFRIFAFLEDSENSRDKMLTLRLKNELPSNYNAVKVSLRLNVPACINRISQQLNEPDQLAELNTKDKQLVWTMKRIPGKAEYIAYFRLINDSNGQIKKEDIGPVLMDFEISGYTSSGLQIKYLKVQEMGKKISLNKWIRLITVSDSYVIKLW